MELDKPTVEAAAQAPDNHYNNMMKVIERLEKKVDLQSKKVRDRLLTLMHVCAGHLLLTLPLLENLIIDLVTAGWEEVEGAEEKEGEEGQVCHNRKEKGQQGKSRPKGRQNHQKRQVGWRALDETKVEGQQEEGWQKVGHPFGLDFSKTDCGLVSGISQYEFSDLYRLDWALFVGSCHFLCMASPPPLYCTRAFSA